MTTSLRRTLAALALCLPCVTLALAADAPAGPEARVETTMLAAQAAIQTGPRDIALGEQGVLKLPEGFGFIPKAEAAAMMEAQGNHSGPGFMGLIVGPDLKGFIAVEFAAAGYIKDEDAREWNADDMLEKMKTGTEAANASSAPCFAVLHTCTTVERSTPNFAAASRWVACWVRTCTNNSYFSEGANRLRDLLPAEDLGLTSDICSNLSRRKRTESLAGY